MCRHQDRNAKVYKVDNLTGSKKEDDDSRPSYTDHSRSLAQLDLVATITAAAFSKDPNFPAKLHRIISTRDEYDEIIAWLPHGRAFRILQPKEFEEKVIPKFFRHGKYASFARQINGWGFRRITTGTDYGAYYHELFLRGMPHLCEKMRRPAPGGIRKNSKLHRSDPSPDFYKISEAFPLPKDDDRQMSPSCSIRSAAESSDDKCPAAATSSDTSSKSPAVGFSVTGSDAATSLLYRAHAIPARSPMPHVPVAVPTFASQQQAAKQQMTAALHLQAMRQQEPLQVSSAPSSGGLIALRNLQPLLNNNIWMAPNTTAPSSIMPLSSDLLQASPWALLLAQQQQRHALNGNILQTVRGLNPLAMVPTPALGGDLVAQQAMLSLPLATATTAVLPPNNGDPDKITSSLFSRPQG